MRGIKFIKSMQKGQELVEFAIVLPLLLLIAFGALDLGRAFHAAITITNVAREGARYGFDFNWDDSGLPFPVQTGYQEIENVAFLEARDSNLDVSDGRMSVTAYCDACDSDDPITVTVNYDFELIMGILPDFTMVRTATMMIP